MRTGSVPVQCITMFRNTAFMLLNLALFSCSTVNAADLPWLLSPQERAELASWYEQVPKGNSMEQWTPVAPDDPALKSRLQTRIAAIEAAMQALPKDSYGMPPADIAVWVHAAKMLLLNDEWRYPRRADYMQVCLDWAEQLADAGAKDPALFSRLRGRFIVAYRSAVDRSVQPYQVVLPAGFNPNAVEPYRIEMFLHGLTRWNDEAVWMVDNMRYAVVGDQAVEGDADEAAANTIIVRPFGRLATGYRSAGEVDVLEVIQDVCRRYPVDPDKIAVSGFSMGGGGTMRVGLLNPGLFACMAPLGMAVFGSAPAAADENYQPLAAPMQAGQIAECLQTMENMGALAVNGRNLPMLMGVGTKDRLSEGHRQFEKLFDDAGVDFLSYYKGGLGHTPGPLFNELYRSFLRTHIRPSPPLELTYATAHLRHAERNWVRIDGLKRQYKHGQIHAVMDPDKKLLTVETKGIARFSILPEPGLWFREALYAVEIDKTRFDVSMPQAAVRTFNNEGGQWMAAADDGGLRKQPGLCGPVSDVFSDPFLCVAPTGTAWNPDIAAWADAQLQQLAKQWPAQYRGELPMKKDIDVTEQDKQQYHLILFGDPESNRIMAEVLRQSNKIAAVPLQWTKDRIHFGKSQFASRDHAPVLIYPSPLAGGRYVVINGRQQGSWLRSVMRDGDADGAPVIGDFAILQVSGASPEKETMVYGGFFDEGWKLVTK